MQVILQVGNHPPNLQVDDENNAHSPQYHIYLVSYLVLDGNGPQNSDGTQNSDGDQNSDGTQNSDGAQNSDGTPESCRCFPEGLSITLSRTEVVRPSPSRNAVPIDGFQMSIKRPTSGGQVRDR